MKLGVIFPQLDSGIDPMALREYAQAIEEMGCDHIGIYDHVLGADTTNRPEWSGPYTKDSLFHEPFVFFGFLASCTTRVELVSEVIILPQRQTALAAKQAAEVDVLTGGRLRLGVGLGWNAVEYEALGEDFHTRGRLIEEQMEVMRALWTGAVIDYQGRWHHIVEAGINPLPVQRPIPLWMGGGRDNERALQRIARLADGWFPQSPVEQSGAAIQRLHQYMREAGRDPASLGIEARINAFSGPPESWRAEADAWAALGTTHLSFNTMRSNFTFPDDHINAARQFMDVAKR